MDMASLLRSDDEGRGHPGRRAGFFPPARTIQTSCWADARGVVVLDASGEAHDLAVAIDPIRGDDVGSAGADFPAIRIRPGGPGGPED